MLLHGQVGFAEIMAGVIAQLVGRYHVVAPDLPGLGRSQLQGRASLDVPGNVRWLGELIAKTCDQPPVLLGVSMGGSIAARFAVERSDELSSDHLDDRTLGLSPALAVVSGAKTVKALKRAGFQQVSERGSHVKVRHSGRPNRHRPAPTTSWREEPSARFCARPRCGPSSSRTCSKGPPRTVQARGGSRTDLLRPLERPEHARDLAHSID